MEAKSDQVRLAWILGWVLYVIDMVNNQLESILGLFIYPLIGAVLATLAVALAGLLGRVLCKTYVGRLWQNNAVWAILVAGANFLILLFGSHVGMGRMSYDPDVGTTVRLSLPLATLCYYLLIFAIVNFPKQPTASDSAKLGNRKE